MTAPLTLAETTALTRKVTRLSVAVALVLVATKAAAWLASGSVALLASLADSGLDLLASLVTLFAVRFAASPPDAEHRYGHGKAEAFASLLQGGLVFASAALIGRESIVGLIEPKPIEAGGWALGVMVLSIVLTLGLITAQSRVLKQASSVAVQGDRAHYAADLASNLAVMAGIAGATLLGLHWLDGVAGLLVAALLVWSAIGVFREAGGQLMDHELPEEDRQRILALMIEDDRIKGVHDLRTRASGPLIHIQMHADLDGDCSLAEAHTVVVAAEKRVLAAFPSADIIIHPDPRGRAEPHDGPFAESLTKATR